MTAVVTIAAAVVLVVAYPPIGPPPLVGAVVFLMWRRARAVQAAQVERARARAEEDYLRALIVAMRSLP